MRSPIIQPKLTADQVREIRKVHRMSKSYQVSIGRADRARRGLIQDLADNYGVSVGTITKIINRQRWKLTK